MVPQRPFRSYFASHLMSELKTMRALRLLVELALRRSVRRETRS